MGHPIALDGGRFLMGTDHPAGHPQDGEGPARDFLPKLNGSWLALSSTHLCARSTLTYL
jgi:hypothetical protein